MEIGDAFLNNENISFSFVWLINYMRNLAVGNEQDRWLCTNSTRSARANCRDQETLYGICSYLIFSVGMIKIENNICEVIFIS